MSIKVSNLTFSYGHRDVLSDIDFEISKGELVAVLGANGVGKSTLFRCMLGFLLPQKGKVILSGKEIPEYSKRELSQEIGYIPQSYSPTFNYSVIDTVLMGLGGQLNMFQAPNKNDYDKAMDILKRLGIDSIAQQGCKKISGGERQLVLLGRALLQNAHSFIMDEPTANLDYGNGFLVMKCIEKLASSDYTIIWSTHDPNQALRWANRVIALKGGKVIADGNPEDVMTAELLSELYNLKIEVKNVDVGNRKYAVCFPVGGGSDEI